MTLNQIFSIFIIGIIYQHSIPKSARLWVLLGVSLLGAYWLQPHLPIRWLDYSLPTISILIVLGFWLLGRVDSILDRQALLTLVVVAVLILFLALGRYLELPLEITSRPPPLESIAVAMILSGTVYLLLQQWMPTKMILAFGILGLIATLVVLKSEPLSGVLVAWLRTQSGQNPSLALPSEIQWLGFSYLAFRLLHILIDRWNGLIHKYSLRELLIYAFFLPAYTAGPIDRIDRFVPELRDSTAGNPQSAQRLMAALHRIAAGIVKKFLLADSLSLFALNGTNASQAIDSPSLWIMLYAYSLRIYFDFSGYTDIAIGLGMLFGIQLPENFKSPYLQTTISAFWQSWHVTLSTWVRTYIYSPLSRAMLRRKKSPLTTLALGTTVTMIVIGLWHGVNATFLTWGLWHAGGLIAHRIWSQKTGTWYSSIMNSERKGRLWNWMARIITFHFVTLGWVLFVAPDIGYAIRTFADLFGF